MICLMLHTGRCGSSWLTEILRRHPRINVHKEPFVDKSAVEQNELLLRYAEAGNATDDWLLVTTKIQDIRDITDLRHFAGHYCKCLIAIRRKNLLKQALSMLGARELQQRTGKWNLYSRAEAEHRVGSLRVDPIDLLPLMRFYRYWSVELYRFTIPGFSTLCIFYEDLQLYPAVILDDLTALLDLSLLAPDRPSVHKNMNDDLRQAIENYDEVAAALRGTAFEGYLQ